MPLHDPESGLRTSPQLGEVFSNWLAVTRAMPYPRRSFMARDRGGGLEEHKQISWETGNDLLHRVK